MIKGAQFTVQHITWNNGQVDNYDRSEIVDQDAHNLIITTHGKSHAELICNALNAAYFLGLSRRLSDE